MKSLIVIPARLASSRLPRKLLLRHAGKSVLQHTYESATRACRPQAICVATGDEEIAWEVRRFGGRVELTDPTAATGTDRVAELARRIEDVDVFVNVQGDEPNIAGEYVDLAVELLERHPRAAVATLAAPIRTTQRLTDPACVKVVRDAAGRALYFSRSPIPFPRDGMKPEYFSDPPRFLEHIGLYAYRRSVLLGLTRFDVSSMEEIEKLEQLRFLAAGCTIQVGLVAQATLGIDTLEDYHSFISRKCA
jgi:3-deoxy-manno-octulosonate cytidylyltransferase (CMP-KDO synthetase)